MKTLSLINHKDLFQRCLIDQNEDVAVFSVSHILELLHEPIKADLLRQGEKEAEGFEDSVNMIALEWFDTYIAPLKGEGVDAQYKLDTKDH
tara:strand:+ start:262 stop:534 length:273 start_codon:yes stop_codon:yes gene_type:complete